MPVLTNYWVISYCLVLVNTSPLLVWRSVDAATHFFQLAVYLTYAAFYLVPALLLVSICNKYITSRRWIIYSLAAGTVAIVQIYLFADQTTFKLFDFHINGFVWNLITTPGGIASMGANNTTMASFVGVILIIVLLQLAALFTADKFGMPHAT